MFLLFNLLKLIVGYGYYIAIGVVIYYWWKGEAPIWWVPLIWVAGWLTAMIFGWLDRILGYSLTGDSRD